MADDMPRITEMCSAELNRMARIVQELLDFKVLTTTGLRAEAETADIAATVARVTDQVAARYPLRPVEVTADVPAGADRVACSAEHLELILGKLLDNAAKFGDGEPVHVSVTAERVDDSRIRVSVSDDGPGIPHEYYDRIFEGFVQVEDVPTGQVPGLGVGLYLAQKVVQAYGGCVAVHSQMGAGSTFTFTLPAA
jgi:two-component system sensor histidine kinase ResE